MTFINWGVQAAKIMNDFSEVRKYLEKADGDLTYADMNTNGGLLSPDDAKEFWTLNIKASKLISLGTKTMVVGSTKNMPTIGISTTRISHPHNPGTPLPESQRSSPLTGNVQLTPKWFQAEVPIPDDVVADNIKGEAFRQLVWNLAREQIVSEIELYGINSDTTSTTTDFTAFNGLIASITTNTVDFGGAGITRAQLKTMLQTMPVENKSDKTKLKFITSVNAAEYYGDQLSQMTFEMMAKYFAAGQQPFMPGYMQSAVLDLPVMPENIGTGSNKTVVLYGDPKGIYWGFGQDVKVEFERSATASTTTAVFKYRFDCKPAAEVQWVKGYDVAPTP